MSAISFADPLTERLLAFVRGIGIDVRTATLPVALEPKRAATIGVEPYPHMLRWLR
jgi:hypothetical protein